MQHFGIVKDWSQAGFFETEKSQQLQEDIKAAIFAGRLIAI